MNKLLFQDLTIIKESIKLLLVMILLSYSNTASAQYTKTHYIAPSPWEYYNDANELIITTTSTVPVVVTIKKSNGLLLSNWLTTVSGTPLRYRFPASGVAANSFTTVLSDRGLIVSSTAPIGVQVRNVASDVVSCSGSCYAGSVTYTMKGNTSFSSLGDQALGTNFRLGYYTTATAGTDELSTPLYIVHARDNGTNVLLNGTALITLNAGQSYIFQAAIGSLVTSDNPIVVMSSRRTDGSFGCADGVINPVIPTSLLGTQYLIYRSNGASGYEKSIIVATVPGTTVTVTNYNIAGVLVTTDTYTLVNAGDFVSIDNGIDGGGSTNVGSASFIDASSTVAVYSGTADGCEIDMITQATVSNCSGSIDAQTKNFTAKNGISVLPYFGYIIVKSATDIVNFNGVDIETISGVGLRRAVGATGFYLIDFTNINLGSPTDLRFTCNSNVVVAMVESGGGYSMSSLISGVSNSFPPPTALTSAGTTTFTASNSLGATAFQWYFNGNPISGATSYTYVTNIPGDYSVVGNLPNCGLTLPSTPVTLNPPLIANPDTIVTTPGIPVTGTLTTNDNGILSGFTYTADVTQPSPSTGTITITNATTGEYVFMPDPSFTGVATTTYTLCSPTECSTTTIIITIASAPVAVADSITTIQNIPISGDASLNDSSAISALSPLFTIGSITPGTGTLIMDSATGQYTYTPATGFTGTATATYTLCNLFSPPCSTTTITFTVFPILVANPDVIITTPSVSVNGTLTTNDVGVVAGGTYSVDVTQPSSTTGTITVDPATGQYTFTPNSTFTGTASTTYTICNMSVNPTVCSSTTIDITVGYIPVAIADSNTTLINTPIFGNVGTNDSGSDISSSPLFTSGGVTTGTGTLTINASTGNYTYTPAMGFSGTTTATYTLCNLSSPPCSTTTITFTVFPMILANPDLIITDPGVTVNGTLTTNDAGVVAGGTYSIEVTQPLPTTGTITVDPATGQYTFTPNSTFTGTVTTTYTICNIAVTPTICSTTTITLQVGTYPLAVADVSNTIINTPVSGNVGTNDSGSGASVNPIFTGGTVTTGTGTLTINSSTGNYTYTPASGFTGTTTATYTLCNSLSPPCSTTTITFTVFPMIVANPDNITTTPSVSVAGTLTTNDGGIVSGGIYVVGGTQPSPTTGTITINPSTGQYTFTPNPTFTGTVSTTYTICNTAVNPAICSTTTINITVGNIPLAVADGSATMINTPISGNVGTNDFGSNAPLNPIYTGGTVTSGTGTLIINSSTGNYTYTPATGFTGTTTATYTLCNLSSPPCSTTTITFTVFPMIVANPDAITTKSNLAVSGTLTTNDIGVVAGGIYSVTVTQPSPTTGTITLNPSTGQYTFTPNPTYTGTTSTTYTVCNIAVNPVVCSSTTITITVGNQQIGVSKSAISTTKVDNVVNQTTFVFTVKNLSAIPATNVQLIDNLNTTFPSPITYNVSSLTSGVGLTINSSYNGSSTINLLVGTNTLGIGSTETVTLVVNYNMNGSTLTDLFNSGVATSSDANGVLSSDTTNTGNNSDPNGNGNPNDSGENKPTPFSPLPDITLSIPQGFSPNGDGVNDVFIIRGITDYPNNTITILNRWGNVVYKVNGYDNTDKVWNGKSSEGVKYGGNDLPEGTYFYILDLNNDEKPYKGYIYLNKRVK